MELQPVWAPPASGWSCVAMPLLEGLSGMELQPGLGSSSSVCGRAHGGCARGTLLVVRSCNRVAPLALSRSKVGERTAVEVGADGQTISDVCRACFEAGGDVIWDVVTVSATNMTCHNVVEDGVGDSSTHAGWRKGKLTFQDFVTRLARKGLSMSPLFDIPGMSLDRIKIDWLHCADLGVAPEFEGNLMWHLVQNRKVPGRNQAQRIDAVFGHIQTSGVESSLPVLTKGMIWKEKGSGPKMRAQGQEARTLIPWCKAACNDFLSDSDPRDAAIKTACHHLADCYECLDRSIFAQPRLANSCRKFSLQLQALRQASPDSRLWKFKPKHHMFQHLCEESLDCPTLSWCYRDEGFGGTLAQLVRSRGGINTPLKVSTRMLSFFMANIVGFEVNTQWKPFQREASPVLLGKPPQQ